MKYNNNCSIKGVSCGAMNLLLNSCIFSLEKVN